MSTNYERGDPARNIGTVEGEDLMSQPGPYTWRVASFPPTAESIAVFHDIEAATAKDARRMAQQERPDHRVFTVLKLGPYDRYVPEWADTATDKQKAKREKEWAKKYVVVAPKPGQPQR